LVCQNFLQDNSFFFNLKGSLLNYNQVESPQIKKWLLTFYKACKSSKKNLITSKFFIDFKSKLTKQTKKILNEIKNTDVTKSWSEYVFKKEKACNISRIRKLVFIKKKSKSIPSNMQRLIFDISIYIAEAVSEAGICSLLYFSIKYYIVDRYRYDIF